jgi:hypothetical protein
MVEITLEGSILSPCYAGPGFLTFYCLKMPQQKYPYKSYFFAAVAGIRYLSYQPKYR